MPVDAIMLKEICAELTGELAGLRVDRVAMPAADEVLLQLRKRMLLISASTNAPRICLTADRPENPQTPPMFCMLLRKHLQGARLDGVEQLPFERVLRLCFTARTELMDVERRELVFEVMGRSCNLMLLSGDGVIIDALRRTDLTARRQIMPGMRWSPPPPPEGRVIPDESGWPIIEAMLEKGPDLPPGDFFARTVLGVSQLIAREAAARTLPDMDTPASQLTAEQRSDALRALRGLLEGAKRPTMLLDAAGRPKDITYTDIYQYGADCKSEHRDSYSQLVDEFYSERAANERSARRSQDIRRLLKNAHDRVQRRVRNQTTELSQCDKRDEYRLMGDLLSANMHGVARGQSSVRVENFYDPDGGEVEIPLDPTLSPQKNAEKLYKQYRKLKTAEIMLQEQIAKGAQELQYIESVMVAVEMAQGERDLVEIREELRQSGLVKRQRGKARPPAQQTKPMRFKTDGGFTVLVGRNNRQNDELALRTAQKDDIWLHTRDIPGAHAVLLTDGAEPAPADIEQAAALAAHFSRAKDMAQAPVIVVRARHLKKPPGSPPGKVIYKNENTVFVKPQAMDEA